MAQNGARVTIMDTNGAALDEIVERFRGAGQNVRGEVVNVTDRAALDRSFDATARHYGRLDVVFANAGIGGGPGFLKLDGERNAERALESLPGDLWDKIIAVDLNVRVQHAAGGRPAHEGPSGRPHHSDHIDLGDQDGDPRSRALCSGKGGGGAAPASGGA